MSLGLRLLIALGLAAALAVGLFAYNQYLRQRSVASLLEAQRQQTFATLVGSAEGLDVALSKSIASADLGQLTLLLAEAHRLASSAADAVGQVPLGQPALTNMAAFFTQAGDYVYSLARQTARGQSPSSDQMKQLVRLQGQASSLSAELHRLQGTALTRPFRWASLPLPGSRTTTPASPVVDGVNALEKSVQEYPSLTYDGPFADKNINRKPAGLTGPEVTQAQAQDIALRFMSVGGGSFRVARTATVRGNIPAYSFHLIPGPGVQSTEADIDISRTGGQVVWMLKSRPIGNASLSLTDAQARAVDFLRTHGIAGMTPTGALRHGGEAIVNFAGQENGVVIYPDLMKVAVALDNGEILGFDATQYLMSHTNRSLPRPKITEQQARLSLNPQLKVLSSRLAVIPTDDLKEVLTYEFHGTVGEQEFLVYINALTGREEKILRVIRSADGMLTM